MGHTGDGKRRVDPAVLPLAFLAIGLAPTSAGAAAPQPRCPEPHTEICRLMSSSEFVSAYDKAYAGRLEARDAIDEIRVNLRQTMTGTGNAGPAMIGKQLDLALDAALADMKSRMCAGERAPAEAASVIAAALYGAGRELGVRLPAERLGGMTGTFVSLLEPRGARCLCAAVDFDGIGASCAPR